jgi:hypothetical protein
MLFLNAVQLSITYFAICLKTTSRARPGRALPACLVISMNCRSVSAVPSYNRGSECDSAIEDIAGPFCRQAADAFALGIWLFS